jgi:hypothetical protein
MTKITIVCGCNKAESSRVFHSIEEAEQHAKETGHTMHGSITIEGREA